jgi:hypothetical protein
LFQNKGGGFQVIAKVLEHVVFYWFGLVLLVANKPAMTRAMAVSPTISMVQPETLGLKA